MSAPKNQRYLRELVYQRATMLGYESVVEEVSKATGIAINSVARALRMDPKPPLRIRRKTWNRLAAWLDMDSGQLWMECVKYMALELC